MREILAEFRKFAIKGNVVDMGIGIVVGSAFTSIVNSFVKDIINPLIGILTGGIDFSNLYINLSGAPFASLTEAQRAGAPVITYGIFINSIISFLIVSFSLFFVIRSINKLRLTPTEDGSSAPQASLTKSEALLAEIRDLLAAKSSKRD